MKPVPDARKVGDHYIRGYICLLLSFLMWLRLFQVSAYKLCSAGGNLPQVNAVVAKAVLPWAVAEVKDSGWTQTVSSGLALMRCPVKLTSFYWPKQGTRLNPKSSNIEIHSILFVGETGK